MANGVLYLLEGTKPAARLVVSLVTLRQHYAGSIAVVSTDSLGAGIGDLIQRDSRLDVQHVHVEPQLGAEPHRPFLLKTLLDQYTPFDITVYLDCDTVIQGDFSALFHLPSPKHIVVTQFCNWTPKHKVIAHRIARWSAICPDLIGPALTFDKALNSGVFGFSRDSSLFHGWFHLAFMGRHEFIPDEIAMQLLLPKVPAVVLDDRFNCSAKYGRPDDPDVRIIHFHGRKHIGRFGERWRREYQKVVRENVANIQEWTPGADWQLRRHLSEEQANANNESSVRTENRSQGDA